jgi:hypothetical protein
MHNLKYKINLIIILILCLISCSSKRTNIIIAGHYKGNDFQNNSITCDLYIKQISKIEYSNQNGINVIKDSINEKYYSILFTINNIESGSQQISFYNFKDAYNNANSTPISYVDDNDCWLTPFTTNNNQIMPLNECYYSISFNKNNIEIFTYLYFSEELNND